jgi:acyl carrier protein
MPIDRQLVLNEVLKSVRALGDELDNESLTNADEETPLFGAKSGVDSLTLVNVIADVEDHISSELNLDFILADERAMSRRHSPFRYIKTLVDYICELDAETKADVK